MEKFNELINGDKPVLVDFYATWCGPCKIMNPILEDLKKDMGDEIRIIKIDIDAADYENLVKEYRIQSVPTLILFKEGKNLWRQTGALGLEVLKDVIKKNI